MKKVVIIGTGFSAPIGIPVMRGFFCKMQEKYDDPFSGSKGHEDSISPNKIEYHKLFGNVLNAWQQWKRRKSPVEPDDLEDFCSDISASQDLRQDTMYAIGRLYELCMHKEGNKGLAGLWGSFYREFAKDIGKVRDG